jgi:hypothetical protein
MAWSNESAMQAWPSPRCMKTVVASIFVETCPFRLLVTPEHQHVRSHLLKLPDAHNGDGAHRLQARQSPCQALEAGLVVAPDNPSRATDACASHHNMQHTREQMLEMPRVEHNHMIQTLAEDTADEGFNLVVIVAS